MNTTLLSAGLVCLVATAIGGGVKAFGIELPLIKDARHQVLLGILGVLLIFGSIYLPRYVAPPPERSNAKAAEPGLSVHTSIHSAADSGSMEESFQKGLGQYRFGMTPAEINDQLPRKLIISDLPIAKEYASGQVNYIFQPLNSFNLAAGSDPFDQELRIFSPCATGQSYVVFLFEQGKLFKISVRLLSDCTSRVDLLRQFADSHKIGSFSLSAPVVFKANLSSFAVVAYTNPSLTTLEFVSGQRLET